MKKLTTSLTTLLAISSSLYLLSCSGPKTDRPQFATGKVDGLTPQAATNLYNQARALETAGKTSKAIKTYSRLADYNPLASSAPDARFRQASLLYRQGELKKSFDAYQQFIEKYKSSNKYSLALQRQFEVAQAAAGGRIKNNFLGIKSNVPAVSSEKMLNKVISNAPYSKYAPQAQFAIGELWQRKGKAGKAIAAYDKMQENYPSNALTPEAIYRVGSLYMLQAKNGNRNKSNLTKARNAFLDLRQLFPNHQRAKQAGVKLKQLASSDVQRSFDIAEYYLKKGQKQSAIFYYKEVLRLSKSGSLRERAAQRLRSLGQ